jgi:hypothetical protein
MSPRPNARPMFSGDLKGSARCGLGEYHLMPGSRKNGSEFAAHQPRTQDADSHGIAASAQERTRTSKKPAFLIDQQSLSSVPSDHLPRNVAPTTGLLQTVAEHWDGTSWCFVPTPTSSTQNQRLTAVTALSDGTVAAVGVSFKHKQRIGWPRFSARAPVRGGNAAQRSGKAVRRWPGGGTSVSHGVVRHGPKSWPNRLRAKRLRAQPGAYTRVRYEGPAPSVRPKVAPAPHSSARASRGQGRRTSLFRASALPPVQPARAANSSSRADLPPCRHPDKPGCLRGPRCCCRTDACEVPAGLTWPQPYLRMRE